MKVVAYDHGVFVQVTPMPEILQVKLIDLDSFLLFLPPQCGVI
jgi:hypothetical protein